ncbi:phosphodiester glycosidase family protein [Nonomuraea terrae]|uniref:Phosphodiester glycosidase family protein n=1 Tax=Nonomuraea terrae TaxID=2530383 RepID=A0A4R4Y6D0_9ACTN|nr:phosphodiester glycosidase family protein [Nonomuraea terrae]
MIRATAALLAVALLPTGRAASAEAAVPLGAEGLAETRTTRALADGVTLTRIVRGAGRASTDEINTTTRGPWVINVLTIDPAETRGHLRATYGPDLAGTETTTDLVRSSGALAGINASFFTFSANPEYRGDPVGLGLYDGKLLSEPTTNPDEADFVVDADTNRVLVGRLSWSGSVRNERTGATLPLEYLNHPPAVPASCAELDDPTECAAAGSVVRFDPEFAAATPSGPGVEVVLDDRGCVVDTFKTRGRKLADDQTSLQATGRDAAALLRVAADGCLKETSTLVDEDGDEVPAGGALFGVTGRYRLLADGESAVPPGSGGLYGRNPRTIVGAAEDGRIMLATIDGRMATSVGTTLAETAAVARALGMHDAINLDGGGSATMSVKGELVNKPCGSRERAVGDALVFVNSRP